MAEVELTEFNAYMSAVQEHQCIQCQTLGCACTTPSLSEVTEKLFDFNGPHLLRAPLMVKVYESKQPVYVCFFRGIAQALPTNGYSQLVNEPRGRSINMWANIIHEKRLRARDRANSEIILLELYGDYHITTMLVLCKNDKFPTNQPSAATTAVLVILQLWRATLLQPLLFAQSLGEILSNNGMEVRCLNGVISGQHEQVTSQAVQKRSL